MRRLGRATVVAQGRTTRVQGAKASIRVDAAFEETTVGVVEGSASLEGPDGESRVVVTGGEISATTSMLRERRYEFAGLAPAGNATLPAREPVRLSARSLRRSHSHPSNLIVEISSRPDFRMTTVAVPLDAQTLESPELPLKSGPHFWRIIDSRTGEPSLARAQEMERVGARATELRRGL